MCTSLASGWFFAVGWEIWVLRKGLPVSSCVTLREGILVFAALPWGLSERWGVRTFWIQMKGKFTSQSSKWGRQGSQLWKSVSGVYETAPGWVTFSGELAAVYRCKYKTSTLTKSKTLQEGV